MPEPRPVRYFTDTDRKALAPDLVSEKAEALAIDARTVPPSQIRRFYGDVISFDRRLAGDPPPDAIRAQMALLKAKAAYAYSRARRREEFTEELLRFFVDHAAAVKDRIDFAAFRRAFEAVIAYHKFHEQKGQRD